MANRSSSSSFLPSKWGHQSLVNIAEWDLSLSSFGEKDEVEIAHNLRFRLMLILNQRRQHDASWIRSISIDQESKTTDTSVFTLCPCSTIGEKEISWKASSGNQSSEEKNIWLQHIRIRSKHSKDYSSASIYLIVGSYGPISIFTLFIIVAYTYDHHDDKTRRYYLPFLLHRISFVFFLFFSVLQGKLWHRFQWKRLDWWRVEENELFIVFSFM